MVVAMVAAGGYELLRQKRRNKAGTPLTATYVNEFTAIFYGTKRTELDHRDSMSMMREEDAESAPPNVAVDLDNGIVRLKQTNNDKTQDGARPPK